MKVSFKLPIFIQCIEVVKESEMLPKCLDFSVFLNSLIHLISRQQKKKFAKKMEQDGNPQQLRLSTEIIYFEVSTYFNKIFTFFQRVISVNVTEDSLSSVIRLKHIYFQFIYNYLSTIYLKTSLFALKQKSISSHNTLNYLLYLCAKLKKQWVILKKIWFVTLCY